MSNNLNNLKNCIGLSNNLKMLKAALWDVFRMVDVLKGGLSDMDIGDPCPGVNTFAPNAGPKHWLHSSWTRGQGPYFDTFGRYQDLSRLVKLLRIQQRLMLLTRLVELWRIQQICLDEKKYALCCTS